MRKLKFNFFLPLFTLFLGLFCWPQGPFARADEPTPHGEIAILESNYSLWLREFQTEVDQYIRFENVENRDNIQKLIRVKPFDEPQLFPDWLAHFQTVAEDYKRFERPVYKECLDFYQLTRMKNLRQHYSLWFGHLKGHLADYSRFVRPVQKQVCQFFIAVAPRGENSDYPAWIEVYSHYQKQWNTFKREEFRHCMEWLEIVKPQEATQTDLNFLNNIPATVKAIAENDSNMGKFNRMVADYYQELRFQAAHGNSAAALRLEQLEQIFR